MNSAYQKANMARKTVDKKTVFSAQKREK